VSVLISPTSVVGLVSIAVTLATPVRIVTVIVGVPLLPAKVLVTKRPAHSGYTIDGDAADVRPSASTPELKVPVANSLLLTASEPLAKTGFET
jgi:hypothetical protein